MYQLGGELGLQASADRQTVLVALMPFTFEDLVANEAGQAIVLPGGARVIGGALIIDEAFNSAGAADAFDVGDGSNAARYATGLDGRAVGWKALTPTGYRTNGRSTVNLTWKPEAGAAPTQGSGTLLVQYVIHGRGGETQPAVL